MDVVRGVRVDTEGIAAIQAAVVVEHTLIQDIAQNHASGSAGGTTQQRTDDGTTDTAHRCADGSGNYTQRGTCSSTGCRGSKPAIGACRRADHPCGFLAVVVLADPDGQAVGALFRHWNYLCEMGGKALSVPWFTEVI